jgi:hypothetical protein
MQNKTDKSKAGYVKIHRSLFDNPLFTKYPEFIGPWVWIIAKARFKANGIGRGQLELSRRLLHKQFPYLSLAKCQRFFDQLIDQQMIKIDPQSDPSSKNVSKNDKNVKEKSTRGTRLPADWKLPKSWGEWALENRSDFSEAIVRDIAEQFRDHWQSASGQNATKRDWFATWRNWCRRQKIQNQQQSTQEKGGVYALLESEGYFQ